MKRYYTACQCFSQHIQLTYASNMTKISHHGRLFLRTTSLSYPHCRFCQFWIDKGCNFIKNNGLMILEDVGHQSAKLQTSMDLFQRNHRCGTIWIFDLGSIGFLSMATFLGSARLASASKPLL